MTIHSTEFTQDTNSLVTLTTEIEVTKIASYGGDWLIADAARVSSKHSEGSGEREPIKADIGLINSLIKHRHGGPFGHGGLTFFVKAPVFVFREWRTHRIAMVQSTDDFSYSEASARYRPLEPVFYLPPTNRPTIKREDHKAMRPVFDLANEHQLIKLYEELTFAYEVAWNTYQNLLSDGVAPEIARTVLPVGVYSSMYVSCNPRSLMHFLSLRTRRENATFESFPQWEIEVAADVLEKVFEAGWPVTFEAFEKNGRVAP